MEYPPFPGNLEICSSSLSAGTLPNYYYYASFTEQGMCLNTFMGFSNALGLSVYDGICKYFVIRVYECLEKVSKVLLSV